MTGVICSTCWDASNDARPPRCDRDGCPGNQAFKPLRTGPLTYPSATPEQAVRDRAMKAIKALREPDHSLARVPNTVRQSIAEVIEDLLRNNHVAHSAMRNSTE